MDHEQLPYKRVSPKLIPLRQIHNALLFGIPIIAVTIGLLVFHNLTVFFDDTPIAYLLFAIPAGLLIWGLCLVFIIPRQVRAMGYLEKRDDLLLRVMGTPDALQESDLVPSLFDDHEASEREHRITSALDVINGTFGRGTVKLAAQGSGRIKSSSENQSPHYTTLWNDIPKVTVK